VPEHLYEDLPEHFLQVDEKGRKVPDYLRMILMCEYCLVVSEQARLSVRHSCAVVARGGRNSAVAHLAGRLRDDRS
jgi:hypothetical protein